MKAFFKDMNLARAIILVAVLGAVVLGWTGWKGKRELDELRTALLTRVPTLVREIQELSEFHTKLTRDKEGDQFLRQANPESYIRNIGDRANIRTGDLILTPRTDPRTPGVIDQKYTIQPDKREREFSRGQIALFLYTLEAESRRVRVTEAKINLIDQRTTKPEDVPRDAWTFEAVVTSRQKAGG